MRRRVKSRLRAGMTPEEVVRHSETLTMAEWCLVRLAYSLTSRLSVLTAVKEGCAGLQIFFSNGTVHDSKIVTSNPSYAEAQDAFRS